jgi:sarcosine oxidase subunit beta
LTMHACVVGGGVIGLSSAVHLAQRDCDVTLLEQAQLTSGSSSLSVGVYTRQYTNEFDIAMRMYCVDELERLEVERGLQLRRIGYLRLAHDAATLDRLAEGLEVQRGLGLDDGLLLNNDDLRQRLPAMRVDDLAGGLLGQTDGYLDGHELCMTYADIATQLGVDVRTKTRLIRAARTTGGSHRLETTRGEIDCDVVINAAGAWAEHVGLLVGAPLEVIPQRHEACVISLDKPVDYPIPETMDYIQGSGVEGLYFRQERTDALVAGLHTNDLLADHREDPDDYFGGVHPEFEEFLAQRLLDRLPGLQMRIQSGWAGLYPMSSDAQLIVGPHWSDRSVICACGLGGLGIHLSPAVGRMVAEFAVRGRVDFLEGCERLSPDRFRPRQAETPALDS